VIPELVWCQAGNPRFAAIAVAAGFRYGARLPGTTYGKVWFADQDWKKPNRIAYMRALSGHLPTMATVLDWEREEQLAEVLSWAEEAAQYVARIVIVPKVPGRVGLLPRQIGGRPVILGISIPSAYGGTRVQAWEFAGWPVHLLGGQPQMQMRVWARLRHICETVSCDGNAPSLMATRRAAFWVPGTGRPSDDRYWMPLSEAGDDRRLGAPDEAVRRSCANIVAAWRRICGLSATKSSWPAPGVGFNTVFFADEETTDAPQS